MKYCNKIARLYRHLMAIGVLAWLPVLAFGQALSTPPEQCSVLTTIRPLTLLVRPLVADLCEVRELLPPSQDPHHFSLTFAQRRLLDDADMVVAVGPGLEGALTRVLARRDPRTVVIWQPEMGADSGHVHTSADPHIWLDPIEAMAFADRITGKLALLMPDQAAKIEQRRKALEASVKGLDQSLKSRLSGFSGQRYIADHQAYGHFSDRYGLVAAGYVNDAGGVSHGARTFARLSAVEGGACVIVERAPGSPQAQRLAERLHLPVVVIDPLGAGIDPDQGYVLFIDQIARGFERCLSGR